MKIILRNHISPNIIQIRAHSSFLASQIGLFFPAFLKAPARSLLIGSETD